MTPTLLIGLTLAVGALAPKEAPKKEAPTLVGKWELQTIVYSGRPEPVWDWWRTADFSADGVCRLRSDRAADTIGFRTDPKAVPAGIDLGDPADAQANPGRIIRGIYRIDGDTLTVALGHRDRPTKFESAVGSDVVLVTLKRAKPE